VSSIGFLGFSAPLFKAARSPANHGYRLVFGFAAVALASAVVLLAIYGFHLGVATVVAILAVVLAAVLFGPAFLPSKGKSLNERFAEQARDQRVDPFTFSAFLELWISPTWINWSTFVVCVLGFAFLVGHGEATRKAVFLTLRESPDMVVLRNYGDLLVTAKFSRTQKTVSNELALIWVHETKRIDFRNESVGPLAPTSFFVLVHSASPPASSSASSAIDGSLSK
jgi:hypothetical protein